MQVPIDDIIVKKRIRHDLSNIDALAESMQNYGQINPITITKNNILVTGRRRLAAAQSLGWRTINAIIVEHSDETTLLELEIEENLQRQDFSTEEVSEASDRLKKLKNPSFFKRIWMALKKFFKKLFKIEG